MMPFRQAFGHFIDRRPTEPGELSDLDALTGEIDDAQSLIDTLTDAAKSPACTAAARICIKTAVADMERALDRLNERARDLDGTAAAEWAAE